jgi:hypothetical protein
MSRADVQSPAPRTYTIRHECGSPSFRTLTGHSYTIMAELKPAAGRVKELLLALRIQGLNTRVKHLVADEPLLWMEHAGPRGPHPELGYHFVCDAAFLKPFRDMRPTSL